MSNFEKGVILHFDKLAPLYDLKSSDRKNYNTAVDREIVKIFSSSKNLRVLDVGCGTGSRSERLKKKIIGSKFFCLDVSSKMVAIAKGKNLDYVTWGKMTRLPFKDDYFDALLCLFNTFGYLSSQKAREKALSEFWRVLKKNGLLFIDLMNFWHLGEGMEFKRSIFSACADLFYSFLNPTLSVGDKLFKLKAGDEEFEGFVHGFSQWEMKSLLKSAGFSIDKFLIIGYNSGEIKKHFWQGQLFYVCKKIAK
jgi:ubiquinone/menaquinone biosynthesis C-methylase UbiE